MFSLQGVEKDGWMLKALWRTLCSETVFLRALGSPSLSAIVIGWESQGRVFEKFPECFWGGVDKETLSCGENQLKAK